MDLNKLTIVEARQKLDAKEILAVDLTKACLRRIKAVDDRIKACLTVCEDQALKQAKQADQEIKAGKSTPLLGIPFLAKDNLLSKGIKTTAASKMLENYVAPYNATVLEKLEQQGAVLLGKTNLDEFAHGASTENSAFGPTHNPWDLERVPGGSSGGSAAAVAADLCLFALGSDTGGSIRQPASFCGVNGLKPSYGRVSRHGLIAMTSSTDVIGPLTKTVEDAAIVLQAIAGEDKYDATTSDVKVPDYITNLNKDIKNLKVGWPKEYFSKDLSAKVLAVMTEAKQTLESLGAKVVEISLPHVKYGIPVYYIVTPAEVSSNLARFDGLRFGFNAKESANFREHYLKSRGEGFGAEAKRRIMIGTYALSSGYYDAYYLQAEKVRVLINNDFVKAFQEVDVIMAPVTFGPAFKFGANSSPLNMYLEDQFLSAAALAGLPAISVPAGQIEGLPCGLQLMASQFDESTLLKVANNFEINTTWHNLKPEI